MRQAAPLCTPRQGIFCFRWPMPRPLDGAGRAWSMPTELRNLSGKAAGSWTRRPGSFTPCWRWPIAPTGPRAATQGPTPQKTGTTASSGRRGSTTSSSTANTVPKVAVMVYSIRLQTPVALPTHSHPIARALWNPHPRGLAPEDRGPAFRCTAPKGRTNDRNLRRSLLLTNPLQDRGRPQMTVPSDILDQPQGIIDRRVRISGRDSIADAEKLELTLGVAPDRLRGPGDHLVV